MEAMDAYSFLQRVSFDPQKLMLMNVKYCMICALCLHKNQIMYIIRARFPEELTSRSGISNFAVDGVIYITDIYNT